MYTENEREVIATDRALRGVVLEEPAPLAARLYVQYAAAVKHLDELWYLTAQPQKGIAIRRLLDAAIRRLVELKDELIELDISEFHYVDGSLIELKLVPQELELLTMFLTPPRRTDRYEEMINQLTAGERIYVKPPTPVESPETSEASEELKSGGSTEGEPSVRKTRRRPQQPSEDESISVVRPVVRIFVDHAKEALREAVLLIQKHERARQGRLEFFDENAKYTFRKTYYMKKHVVIPPEVQHENAIKLQKHYRGYVARRNLFNQEVRRRTMIGMYEATWYSNEAFVKARKALLDKGELREKRMKEYIEARGRERERVLRFIAPQLAEDIGDEIRYWFKNWHDVAKAFDKYPKEKDGGTVLVVTGQTMTPEEYREMMEKKRREKEMLKNNPGLAAKLKKDAEDKKKAELEKKKKEAEQRKNEKEKEKERAKIKSKEPPPFKFKELGGYEAITEAEEQWDKDRRSDMEKSINPLQQIVMEPITDDECYKMQIEVRKAVDEIMRLELELLEDALLKDHGKKPKKRKKKKKKGKKEKVDKKDLTRNRTIEDLFQELYDHGIIRKYIPTKLSEFFGDFNYKAYDLRTNDFDSFQATGDVRQVIWNSCILPLISPMVAKISSVCIMGPRLTGKHLLANAICTETNSVLFDLTPQVLRGKFETKEEKMFLLHLVNKLSRLLQPSIIFIDGAEKPFYKKVPKPERVDDPKKLGGVLFKEIVKKILPEEKVMLLAITRQPWAAKPKPFLKCYPRIIFVPRPDYSTTYMYWRRILMKFHSVDRNMDLSSLTKLTEGMPIPYLDRIVAILLTPRRRIQLKYKPLLPSELLETIMAHPELPPISLPESNKYVDWYTKKTILGKKRSKKMEEAEQARIVAAIMAAREAKKAKQQAKAKA